MKNIHVLPTDKPSRLGRFIDTNNLFLRTTDDIPRGENINIYITSDEEIKEGDWVIANGGIRFVTSINNYKSKTFTDDGTISKQTPSLYCHLKHYKKIILTTDQDLIKDGVQEIDDEFLEWFVKNPSCEEVRVVDVRYDISTLTNDVKKYPNLDVPDYKIIIPKEEPKQETLEEAATNYTIDFATMSAFKLGAKWQQEQDKNKYSEKEVLEILNHHTSYLESFIYRYIDEDDIEDNEKWFEQFKNE